MLGLSPATLSQGCVPGLRVELQASISRGSTCTKCPPARHVFPWFYLHKVSTRPPRFSVVLLSQSVHQTVTFFGGFAFTKCPSDHKFFRRFYFYKLCIRPPRFSVVSLSQTVHQTKIRMCVWWSLCTLHLHACQVRVTVSDSGLCCCTSATYFER